ncbi:MAG: hypothetical protein QXE31_05470 [Candidatus Woesearchaeota archaeon]
MNNSNQNLEDVLTNLVGLTFEVYMMANDKGELYLESKPRREKSKPRRDINTNSSYSFNLGNLTGLNPKPGESYLVSLKIEHLSDYYKIVLSVRLNSANEDRGEIPTFFNGEYIIPTNRLEETIKQPFMDLLYFIKKYKGLKNPNQYGLIRSISN